VFTAAHCTLLKHLVYVNVLRIDAAHSPPFATTGENTRQPTTLTQAKRGTKVRLVAILQITIPAMEESKSSLGSSTAQRGVCLLGAEPGLCVDQPRPRTIQRRLWSSDFHFPAARIALEFPHAAGTETRRCGKGVFHKLHVGHLFIVHLAKDGEWGRDFLVKLR
jgi:hypothetical protein